MNDDRSAQPIDSFVPFLFTSNMTRRSLTAVEYRVRDAWLRTHEVRPAEEFGCAGELLYSLEALGVGLDDVVRVLRLSELATQALPEPLTDACAHYRIGVFPLHSRRWSAGAQLGAYNGCVFLAWTV